MDSQEDQKLAAGKLLRSILSRLHDGDQVVVLYRHDINFLSELGIVDRKFALELLPKDFYLSLPDSPGGYRSFIVPDSLLILEKKNGVLKEVPLNSDAQRSPDSDAKVKGDSARVSDQAMTRVPDPVILHEDLVYASGRLWLSHKQLRRIGEGGLNIIFADDQQGVAYRVSKSWLNDSRGFRLCSLFGFSVPYLGEGVTDNGKGSPFVKVKMVSGESMEALGPFDQKQADMFVRLLQKMMEHNIWISDFSPPQFMRDNEGGFMLVDAEYAQKGAPGSPQDIGLMDPRLDRIRGINMYLGDMNEYAYHVVINGYPHSAKVLWNKIDPQGFVKNTLMALQQEFLKEAKEVWAKPKASDRAMINEPKGGIDLTPATLQVQTQNATEGIKFRLDPAVLIQLQNAPGFVPVIVNVQPLSDIKLFLGIESVKA